MAVRTLQVSIPVSFLGVYRLSGGSKPIHFELVVTLGENVFERPRPEGEVLSINIAPLKRSHKPDPRFSKLSAKEPSVDAQIAGLGSPTGGARGNLHLEGRTLPQPRLDPNATAVHLHNLFGDGEPETGATLGLGNRAVDLVELLENPRLMLLGDARTRVCHTDGEVAADHLRGHAHLARVGELDCVADEVEEHLS